jgi:hypothetical protein
MNSAGSPDPSDSAIQRQIEQEMLDLLQSTHPEWTRAEYASVAVELGLPLVWQKTKPDGVWKNRDGSILIAECFTRIERINPGQRRKIAMDVLKLIAMRSASNTPGRVRCLFIIPEELNRQLQANDWLSATVRKEVEVIPIQLNDAQRQTLSEAVKQQSAGQARIARKGKF